MGIHQQLVLASLFVFMVTLSSPSEAISLRHRFIIEHVGQVAVSKPSTIEFNVMTYGAKGDGRTDDGEAFDKAWMDACTSSVPAVLVVPETKTFLLKPITFSGPCKSHISMMIEGTLQAPSDMSDWDEDDHDTWIVFDGITNLMFGGGGIIDGNGQIWWKNSCKSDKSNKCSDAPTALKFNSCNQLTVESLTIRNSQQMHVTFDDCNNVVASGLTVTAPGNSPNTDGIHVTHTKNIWINNCVIATGDDCISIVSGSQGVTATNITCGPGHGISIGSLGDDHSQAQVSNVFVDTATISGTTNGLRIKTYQGGSGFVKNITFQNINLHDVQNPIIIDQNYCDSDKPCKIQKSAVAVSNVLYKSIKGTSASPVAINFDCSKTFPCQEIVLQDIDITGGGASLCENVNWTKKGIVVPSCV